MRINRNKCCNSTHPWTGHLIARRWWRWWQVDGSALNGWWCKPLDMSSVRLSVRTEWTKISPCADFHFIFILDFSSFFFFFFSFLYTELHHMKTTSWKHSYRFIAIIKCLTWRCIAELFTCKVFTYQCCNRFVFVF